MAGFVSGYKTRGAGVGRRRAKKTVGLLAATALALGGGGVVSTAPANAQAGSAPFGSSQVVGSIADVTPQSLVQLGEPMATPAPHEHEPIDSGLTWDSVPDTPGEAIAEVPLDPSLGLDNASEQYRVVYSTTNQHGEVAASTGAIFLPKGEKPEGGWPVLAWAHGTVGLDDQCTPSMNPRSDRDASYLNYWLDQGYAIVSTDYAGQGTPGLMSYLNAKATADSVIDSVIAAHKTDLASGNETPVLSKEWAVIGQSQGGGAALNVAHAASGPSQAAGLDYLGAVTTGAPAYIEEIVLGGGPTFPPVALPAGLNAYAMYIIAGFREAHPEVDVNSALTEEGKHMVEVSEQACLGELADALEGTNIARAFSKPLRSVPSLEKALRDYMATPTSGYDRPVFMGHGMEDMDVPTPIGVVLNSQMWLNQFLGNPKNAKVEVKWYPTDHSGTMNASIPDSTPFLKGLFG